MNKENNKNVMLNSFQHPLHFLRASKVEILKQVQDDNIIRKTRGFTLIELLVVVLIIGILAAVAVPQYQKAVEKAKATEAMLLLKTVANTAEQYYLANGQWPTNFNQLDITIPWTGKETWRTGAAIKDTISNENWSLQLFSSPNADYSAGSETVYIGRISGAFRGVGFILPMRSYRKESYLTVGKVMCVEKMNQSIQYQGTAGTYCQKIFHGTIVEAGEGIYSLP